MRKGQRYAKKDSICRSCRDFTVTATVTVYAESAEKLCYLENTDKSGIGVSAVSAILIEADTGTVLFLKTKKNTDR